MSDQPFQAKVTAHHLRREQIQINFSHSSYIADHEPALGGDGLGPPPGHLLLGALASSTAVLLARYAHELGLPVTSITVLVDSDLGREALEGPVPARIYNSKIRERIEVSGELTPSQLATLQEIAEQSMVGNTLRRGVEVEKQVVLVSVQ